MPKFFVKDEQIKQNKIEIIENDAKHIINVLRMKIQDELEITNVSTGLTYITKIEEILPDKVIGLITDCIQSFAESEIEITIFQGLPKADKMEYIIQKSTELGAKIIVPVAMERCIVKLDEKAETKKIERWQKIAEAAAKQSGRQYIPKIENTLKIQEICEMVNNYDILLLAYENESENTLKIELQNLNRNLKKDLKIGVVIGPEGGIDNKEVEKLVSAGAKKVTLGKRILRTETASIMIISNIIYELEM